MIEPETIGYIPSRVLTPDEVVAMSNLSPYVSEGFPETYSIMVTACKKHVELNPGTTLFNFLRKRYWADSEFRADTNNLAFILLCNRYGYSAKGMDYVTFPIQLPLREDNYIIPLVVEHSPVTYNKIHGRGVKMMSGILRKAKETGDEEIFNHVHVVTYEGVTAMIATDAQALACLRSPNVPGEYIEEHTGKMIHPKTGAVVPSRILSMQSRILPIAFSERPFTAERTFSVSPADLLAELKGVNLSLDNLGVHDPHRVAFMLGYTYLGAFDVDKMISLIQIFWANGAGNIMVQWPEDPHHADKYHRRFTFDAGDGNTGLLMPMGMDNAPVWNAAFEDFYGIIDVKKWAIAG